MEEKSRLSYLAQFLTHKRGETTDEELAGGGWSQGRKRGIMWVGGGRNKLMERWPRKWEDRSHPDPKERFSRGNA